jgi:ankyrin repeat protein
MAAARGDVEKARVLLDAGARVDQRSEIDGCETPLMQAAAQGRAETVRLLLEHGADPSMRDTVMQRTALDVARNHAKGADPDVYAHLQSDENRIDIDAMLAAVPEGILSPEDIERIRWDMKDFDAAETYRDAADKTALEGDFPETIRLLADALSSRAQMPNGNS